MWICGQPQSILCSPLSFVWLFLAETNIRVQILVRALFSLWFSTARSYSIIPRLVYLLFKACSFYLLLQSCLFNPISFPLNYTSTITQAKQVQPGSRVAEKGVIFLSDTSLVLKKNSIYWDWWVLELERELLLPASIFNGFTAPIPAKSKQMTWK